MNRLFLCMGLALLVAACGPSDSSGGISPAKALSMAPADPDLAELYQSSCRACHATAAGGAPRTGSAMAWRSRLAKGMSTLVDHTITGFQGMPPMGLCSDCSEAELRALIEFMATPPVEDDA
ncbi:MAG: cytochrome c5 family protein [Abyssibacter sp.]|nr:c-type cytochrome [Abyssibacter sp.]MCK5860120.1 cytochrome c5 family protein [Abyssibacter sp.]